MKKMKIKVQRILKTRRTSGFTWKGHIEASILGKDANSSKQTPVRPKIELGKYNVDGGGRGERAKFFACLFKFQHHTLFR